MMYAIRTACVRSRCCVRPTGQWHDEMENSFPVEPILLLLSQMTPESAVSPSFTLLHAVAVECDVLRMTQ